MQKELIIAVAAGLGGMLGWGFADFFAKKTIDEIGDVVSLVWAHVFGTIILGTIVIWQLLVVGKSPTAPVDASHWGGLLFFGLLQGAVYLLVYKGFAQGKVAILSPVFASYSGLAALFSIAVLGEQISVQLLIALFTIFAGILLLNLDIKVLHMKGVTLMRAAGLKEIGLAAVAAAFWTVYWDNFVGGRDWLSYAFYMYGFMTFGLFVFARVKRIPLAVKRGYMWKFLALIGLCEVVAYVAISWGFSATTATSIVAILSGAFSLPTMVLAHYFLKERITAIQRVGGLVIITGIILLALR